MANSGHKLEPFEFAKLIDSRIHEYARDSLQRFALVFSLGSVAVSLLFAAAVRMFLVCPITRLHFDNSVWFAPLFTSLPGKILLLLTLLIALVTFVGSLCQVFAVFRHLHFFKTIKISRKLEDEKKYKFRQLIWLKPISILALLDVQEIWRNVAYKLQLTKVRNDIALDPSDDSFNILMTRQIASYESANEFEQKFAELFNNGTDLGKVVKNILRDTYRIVQRTLIIDRWYFVEALRLLLCSFGLICALNFFFFLGAVFMRDDKIPAKAAKGVETLMLSVDREFIDLDIYKPLGKAEAERFPAVIVVPGGRGKNYVVDPNTGARFRGYNDLASELAKRGFCSLVFDGRGQGRSEGLRSHENGLADLRKILDFVGGLPEIDSSRIGVFGRCGGAAIALHLASTDSRIKSIMTWGMPPRFDKLDRMKFEQRLLQAGIRLKKGAAFLNGEDAALNVRQPILVAGGTKDTTWFFIGGNSKQQLYIIDAISTSGASNKVRLEVMRGAPHAIDSKHKCFEQFVDLVSEWFQDTLK